MDEAIPALTPEREIPPRREIGSKNDGSHPKEKSDQEATDPTPKRNIGGGGWENCTFTN